MNGWDFINMTTKRLFHKKKKKLAIVRSFELHYNNVFQKFIQPILAYFRSGSSINIAHRFDQMDSPQTVEVILYFHHFQTQCLFFHVWICLIGRMTFFSVILFCFVVS